MQRDAVAFRIDNHGAKAVRPDRLSLRRLVSVAYANKT
jgi:hypothetical protein